MFGEGVEIEMIIGGGFWNIFIDLINLESVIFNLVINVCDVMEGCGKFIIEVGNVYFDDSYVCVYYEVKLG